MMGVMFPKNAISDLIREAERFTDPVEGQLVVSEDCVMRSAAGFYVGQFCVEYMPDGEWFPQPWDRSTQYTDSQEIAETWLDA